MINIIDNDKSYLYSWNCLKCGLKILSIVPVPTSSSRTVYPLCFEVMSLYVNYSLCVIFNDFEPPNKPMPWIELTRSVNM